MKETLFLALGGNQDDVAGTFARAVGDIATLPFVTSLRRSSIWRTQPLGSVLDQPWFWNVCLQIDTDHAPNPSDLLAHLLEIEDQNGRVRPSAVLGGPRTLDIDMLLWGQRRFRRAGPPKVVVPHPRMHERAFVLAPLMELLGGRVSIPGLPGTLHEHLARALDRPGQAIEQLA